MTKLTLGDRVVCVNGSIDEGRGSGMAGRVIGFTSLSSHHPREVAVRFEDGFTGYFWARDVAPEAVAA